MDFLYLDEAQMLKAGVDDMSKCMESMEEMFRLVKLGDYRMGGPNNNEHGVRVKFPKTSAIPTMPLDAADRWFTAMPAYLGGKYRMVGFKTYGSTHENAKRDLPRSILMMQLLDVNTAAPVAYMSANIMSAMRTGAVAGVGVKWLAPKAAKKVAIIGPGVMSRYALRAIMATRPSLTEISVLGRSEKGIAHFREFCQKKGFIFETYTECSSVEQVCENADIIFTGNTRAATFEENPYISECFVKKGTLVIASSSVRYDREFLDNEDKCVCVCDLDTAYESDLGVDTAPAKEGLKNQATFNTALHKRFSEKKTLHNISDIITDPGFVRDESKVYVYGAYGMPIEDVAWGCECYRSAKRQGIGTRLNLWEQSQL